MDLAEIRQQNLTEKNALAAWSGLCEPGETRIGSLVRELGARDALSWAACPFRQPSVSVEGDGVDSNEWRLVHDRLRPRLAQMDIHAELEHLQALGGRLVVPGSPDWPEGLGVLETSAPFALWVKGELPAGGQERVGIVGARASTSYGNSVAQSLAYDLTETAVCVVSGGAYGIDAAAHRGALRGVDSQRPPNWPTPTLAVLCGGLGNPYPSGNANLFREILKQGGGFMTEMPPSFRPARWRFLQRNRLIAAMSDFVVVVEATRRSGALATATKAAELGIEVGSVPGPVTSSASAGTNNLLKDGASVITGARDVLDVLRGIQPELPDIESNQATSSVRSQPGNPDVWFGEDLRPVERRAWDALPRHGTAALREVAAQGGLSEAEIAAGLLALQIRGLATVDADSRWARATPTPSPDTHR